MDTYKYHETPLYEFYVEDNGNIKFNVYHNYAEIVRHGVYTKKTISFIRKNRKVSRDMGQIGRYLSGYLCTFDGNIEHAKAVITHTLHEKAEKAIREYEQCTKLINKIGSEK